MTVDLFLLLLVAYAVGDEAGELEFPGGFEADLVVEAPEIRRPTVLCSLDDGSLLVAEGGEASAAPSDRRTARILRLVFERGGPRTVEVFADGLHDVLGIEQIDGHVYVMNPPNLTRYTDFDGDGRTDQHEVILAGLGQASGGAAGIRMAMDGFLYLSVGERGLPLTTGRDGSTVSLRGGGVVRLRPDGTRLELVATGLHDHRELALDERGELFAFGGGGDPTDGATRLTHVVDGGYYGFPFDVREHPERALPSIGELGRGFPGGGFAYTDAIWPRSTHGNLFWCEPDRQVLTRIELEPDGAGFRVFGRHDFVSAGSVKDFRPIDACTSADGRCLYIADSASAGRVWRLRLAGDPPDRPWRMRPLPRDQGALVDALADPSFRRRLSAQRAIERLEPNELLIEHLSLTVTDNLNEQKRRHALWALAELDRRAARDAAVAAFDLTEDTCVQALRVFGQHARQPTVEMFPLLAHGSPRVRRAAAAALGRLGGGPAAVRLATAHGFEDDPIVRWTIRRALARIGVWNTEIVNWAHLASDPDAELLLALHEVYDIDAVRSLTAFVRGADGSVPDGWAERLGQQRARALTVLAGLHRRPEPRASASSQRPQWPPSTRPPPRTVEWEGTTAVVATVREALADPTAAVRSAALEAVGSMPDRGALPIVRARFAEEPREELRLAIVEVLTELRDGESVELLALILRDPQASSELQQGAVRAAGTIGTRAALALVLESARRTELSLSARVESLHALGEFAAPAAQEELEEQLGNPRGALRIAAARALARCAGTAAAERLTPLLEDRSVEVQLEVIEVLGELGARAAAPALLELLGHPKLGDAALRALARLPDARALDALLGGLERPVVREACRAALRSLRDEIRPELERRLLAGELSAERVEQLRPILIEPAPILAWTIVGPTGDGALEPRVAGATLRFESSAVAARAELEHGCVEAGGRLPAEAGAELYGIAEIHAGEPREVELVLGSDDGLDLWIAGELVHTSVERRRWSPDQERVVVQLGAGANQLVVRVDAAARFSVAVLGRDDGPFFDDAPAPSQTEDGAIIEAYRSFALESPGDSSRGFQLFRDHRRLACLRCHTIASPRGRLGDRVGPDLDRVGARLDRAALIEALLEPSRSVAGDYRAETIRTVRGELVFGQVTSEGRGRLTLHDTAGEPRVIPLNEIAERRPSRGSVMPARAHTRVSLQEFADLIEFLETLGRGPGKGESESRTERQR